MRGEVRNDAGENRRGAALRVFLAFPRRNHAFLFSRFDGARLGPAACAGRSAGRCADDWILQRCTPPYSLFWRRGFLAGSVPPFLRAGDVMAEAHHPHVDVRFPAGGGRNAWTRPGRTVIFAGGRLQVFPLIDASESRLTGPVRQDPGGLGFLGQGPSATREENSTRKRSSGRRARDPVATWP